MRCPKCRYLSFEPEPRCKNCGYDLAFGPDEVEVKVEVKTNDGASESETVVHVREAAITVPMPAPVVRETPVVRTTPVVHSPAAAATATLELPLFVQTLSEPESTSIADFEIEMDRGPAAPALPDIELPEIEDQPLVRLPPAPRPPLSVRRPTPAPGRVREKYARNLLDPELEPDALPSGMWAGAQAEEPAPVAAFVETHATIDESVGAFRRLEAAALDVLFLGAINLVVVWLTLQRCGLTIVQLGLLPVWPVAAFLFILNAGYLLLFTATQGQTIGKMAAGIRVVGAPDAALPDHLTLKQAVLRSLLTFPSVLVLGAGFFPALFGSHAALHDRFTHTRVVRV